MNAEKMMKYSMTEKQIMDLVERVGCNVSELYKTANENRTTCFGCPTKKNCEATNETNSI